MTITATERRTLTAYVVPHTHWDREWYRPHRVFQLRLADVLDRVLELLEDDAYRSFTLDGQAIILDDYLEIRPEREEEIRRRVREGRLRIGPWYVLADEFLVSPEALVRNLMLGLRICERFGNPQRIAYTPDSFGHISQLPLIASGFGLDGIIFSRGLGDEGERLGSEFIWQARCEGVEVFSAHLVGTYSGGTALGHVSWELADAYDEERAMNHLRAALYGVQGDEVADLPAWFGASLERVNGGLANHARGSAMILMNGSDHLFPQPNLVQVLARAREEFPEVDFVQGDVEEYLVEARRTAGPLARYRGELRGSRYQHILAGVLSARLYLKQANAAGETLLESYAEPLSALARAAGARYPAAFLWQGWKLLLQNHPHDSICGCSVDSVHREMMTRFEGSRQIAGEVCRQAFEQLTGGLNQNIQDVTGCDPDALTAFNPLPVRRRALVEHTLRLPAGAAADLAVFDASGRRLSAQIEVTEAFVPGRSDRRVDVVHLRALAELPPLGLANLRVASAPASGTADGELIVRGNHDGVMLGNGSLRLTVAADGAAAIRHLSSGEEYPLRLTLEDSGDAGDEYDYSPVAGDEPLLVAATAARPVLLESGPVAATVRLEYRLELPERLAGDRRQRTGRTALPVTLDLTVAAACPYVGMCLQFDNNAMDHRLRLRVATGVHTDSVWADGHYDVLERPVEPPAGETWFQAPPGTNHQRRFVLAGDGRRGLAIFNRGLPEYEALRGPDGVDLAVTLVRSVGWLSRDDLSSRPQGAGPAMETPEAQCPGRHTCELALYPFSGEWWNADVLLWTDAFRCPPMAAPGAAASTAGLLEISGPVQLSAVKRAESRDSLIVRIVNPAPVVAEADCTVHAPVAAVYRTRLDETRLEQLPHTASVPLRLGAGCTETLEFVLEGGGAGN